MHHFIQETVKKHFLKLTIYTHLLYGFHMTLLKNILHSLVYFCKHIATSFLNTSVLLYKHTHGSQISTGEEAQKQNRDSIGVYI